MGARIQVAVLLLTVAVAMVSCAGIPDPAVPTATPTLPACTAAYDQLPFPTLTPAPVEALQNVARTIDDCWIDTDSIDYPCTRREPIEETFLSQTPTALLILRHETQSAGCWTAITAEQTLLRHVDRQRASTTIVAQHIRSEVVPLPDGTAFVFGASEAAETLELKVYLVRVADGQVTVLTPPDLPQPQVVGVRFLGGSDDGVWLRVSLWDGAEDGWHEYRLRTDGSGAFEQP